MVAMVMMKMCDIFVLMFTVIKIEGASEAC